MSNSLDKTFDDMSSLKSSPKSPKIFIIKKNSGLNFPRIIKGFEEADKIIKNQSRVLEVMRIFGYGIWGKLNSLFSLMLDKWNSFHKKTTRGFTYRVVSATNSPHPLPQESVSILSSVQYCYHYWELCRQRNPQTKTNISFLLYHDWFENLKR